MASISIQLPALDADQSIEITVKINGAKKLYNYRVEVFPWDKCAEQQEKAACLKDMIGSYDKNWQLLFIGSEADDSIPVMFKQKDRIKN